jgi:hypothetical protein
MDRAHPAAPRPDDLPPWIPAITDTTAFAAIGPSSRIADFTELGDLATKAFARILDINLWFLTEIWLPVRGYYSNENFREPLDLAGYPDKLMNLAYGKYREAEEFGKLPPLLRDLAVRSAERGLNSFRDVWRVRKDKEIIRLRNELKALLDRLAETPSSPSTS